MPCMTFFGSGWIGVWTAFGWMPRIASVRIPCCGTTHPTSSIYGWRRKSMTAGIATWTTHSCITSFANCDPVTDSYPDTVLVGEVGIHHRARWLRYYGSGDELQLAFDFGFWANPWDAPAFRASGLEQATSTSGWPTH